MNSTASRRWLVAVAAIFAAVLFVRTMPSGRLFKPFDYVQYWAAARLTLAGQNTYDPELLRPLEVEAGWETETRALMMWNPPWAIPLVLPLGAISPGSGQLAWFALQLAAMLISADLLWRMFGGAPDRRWIAWLATLTFAPTAFLLVMGQISGLLLLGYVGFIAAIRAGRPGWAGCAAALTAIKPHLFALFAVVIALESLRDRKTRRAACVGLAVLIAASLAPMIWAPDVWSNYLAATRRPPSETFVTVEQWRHPTPGFYLRQLIPGEPFAAQFVPLAIATGVVPIYWFVRRRDWNWSVEAPRLALACALTACYGAWAFDLVLLLPAVIWSAVRLANSRRPALIVAFATVYLLLNGWCVSTLMDALSQENPWIAPAVLAGFLSTQFVSRERLIAR